MMRPCLRCGELTGNLVCDGCYQTDQPQKMHDDCGYRWDLHDTRDPLTSTPFGCPTELIARLRWGR